MEKKSVPSDLVSNAFDLIRFAWDKKRILIGLSALAFIASVIVSSTITPRYRSSVVSFTFQKPGRNIINYHG
jgi:LPS O-antigen subunit length determinant protein (WzzB/FepE family)